MDERMEKGQLTGLGCGPAPPHQTTSGSRQTGSRDGAMLNRGRGNYTITSRALSHELSSLGIEQIWGNWVATNEQKTAQEWCRLCMAED